MNIRHFTDDGYSGINFNRSGFTALLEEVKAGNVYVICVKDTSKKIEAWKVDELWRIKVDDLGYFTVKD